MRKLVLYIGMCLAVWCGACIDDQSTLDYIPLSKIEIITESDTISQDLGFELVYEPKEIKQSIEGMELSYEWACNGYTLDKNGQLTKDVLRVISKERVLKYTFKKLGQYDLRLKVTNEHGSSFKNLTVFVRAAFEEGYFMLSKDQAGKGRVSFMRTLSREEIAAGEKETFNTAAFSTVNPDYALNDPVGVCMAGLNIFLLSRKDRLMYSIDAQTFDMLGVTDFKTELPWMKPAALLWKNYNNAKMMVISETGGIAWVDYFTGVAYDDYFVFPEKDRFDNWYMRSEKSIDFTFFVNYEESKVAFAYYTPYYEVVWKEFPGEELLAVVMDESRVTWSVAKDQARPEHFRITSYGFNGGNGDPWQNPETYEYDDPQPTLTRSSQIMCNKLYNGAFFYNNGNKLYRWVPGSTTPRLPDKAVITLSADCEITCFNFSPDQKQIYLGVVDSSLPGLKGCMYIYDADKVDPATGELQLVQEPYCGIADRPVNVFYKPVAK